MSSRSRSSSSVKKGVNQADRRNARNTGVVSIRKDKRETGLQKRRNLNEGVKEAWSATSTESTASTSAASSGSTSTSNAFDVKDFPNMVKALQSSDLQDQIVNLRGFRRLLSVERAPPIQECIDCGSIPLFVEFLNRDDSKELQFEAAWALTNIGSTDYTHLIVEHNAVVPLVRCLGNADADVREQAAWCLGNVAGDSPDLRDVVLNCGAMNLLLQNLAQPHNISLLRNCTWALSNFCRGKKPEPPLPIVAPALPALAHLVINSNDNETMVDATWALSYISDGENERIQAVIEQPGLLEMLVKMCTSDNASLIVPALRVLGNCVSGDDKQTQAVLNAGGLSICDSLLEHTKKNIRKETCWMLSNVAAGTSEQLSQLMQHPSILTQVLKQMGHGYEWDVRKEAAYVVSNIATAGNTDYTTVLVQLGAVQPICSILGHSDAKILTVALEALEYFLMVGNNRTDIDVLALMDEVDGVDKLEELQEHEDVAIYEKSVHLIETYFDAGEDADENIAPAITSGSSNQFSFGLHTPATGDSKIDFGNAFVAKQPAADQRPAGAFGAFSQQSGFGAPSSQFNFSM